MPISLNDLARSVAEADSLEKLTRTLLQVLEAVTGLESVYLTRIDAGRRFQEVLYARNQYPERIDIPEGLSVPWGDTVCRRAIEDRTPFTTAADEIWGDLAAVRALGIRTYLSEPVRDNEGALLGTLCAVSNRRAVIGEDTYNVVNLFAMLIAHQFARESQLVRLQQNNDELAERATTDPLTGIVNRRGLVNELSRALAQAARRDERIGVVFIDLDGFKRINDLHGHQVGDHFLITIAARLAGATRAGDLLARYGGDEFVVFGRLTADAAGWEAAGLAMASRFATATHGCFELGSVVLDYAGASVGMAVSGPEEGVEALLHRADAAMYASKTARRATAPPVGLDHPVVAARRG